MASTDKQNFRCDTETRWLPFKRKIQDLAALGYRMPNGDPVDMTSVLVAEVDRVRKASIEETAERLGLKRPVRA